MTQITVSSTASTPPAPPRVALITGGSTGIGAATAKRLLADGYRVAVTARREERLNRLAADLGKPAELLLLPGDSSDEVSVGEAVEATVRQFGRLDAVVANAAFATVGDMDEGDPAQWRSMVLTNVLGPALLARAALPELKRSRGRIVLVGSVAGLVYSRGNLYGATKWAVTGLAENLRLMVTGDGVGVTLVNPGRVDSAFWEPHGGLPDGPRLTSDQLAETVAWAMRQPDGVDINTVTVRPIGAEL